MEVTDGFDGDRRYRLTGESRSNCFRGVRATAS